MRVSVYGQRHGEAIDRIFEAARSDKGIDLERFTLDRLLDRRLVQQRDPRVGTQAHEGRFELQRLVQRFVDELLDDGLAPRAKGPGTEAASEPLHPRNADTREL